MNEEKKDLNKENEPMALADESRVKVMSPGMMVYKRFIRNKLAITGLVIIVAMFLFCFLGGTLYRYRQEQVFRKMDYTLLDFANAKFNTETRFTVAEGQNFPNAARSAFYNAASRNETEYEAGGTSFNIEWVSDEYALITGFKPLVKVDVLLGRYNYNEPAEGFNLTDELKAAFQAAFENGDTALEYEGNTYTVIIERRSGTIAEAIEYAVASPNIFDTYNPEDEAVVSSFEFHKAVENAKAQSLTAFDFGAETYTFTATDEKLATVYDAGGRPFAEISDIIISSDSPDVVLPTQFKADTRHALAARVTAYQSVNVSGEPAHYVMMSVGDFFNIKTDTETELIARYEQPSLTHPLGTDDNGMDVLARLMFGGRISITVGFVVIFIEVLIGVILGGISGYFSGWVDTAIMRFVDLFNTIPMFPLMLILASIMDAFRIEPMTRVYILMGLLGILGWPAIARIVRGQILSLREQDYMVAAESMGLSVSRRIFRHLVPNVMPLLIVYATMGIGSVIIMEATLSFLGMGIKYPMASWGQLVNSATDVFILSNYPLTWMPAGVMIFLTVLGFNFVGDGLRDAFDPKMKR